MITRKKKEEIVAAMADRFKRSSCFYVIDFLGLNYQETLLFRRAIKKQELEYRVAKNTLICRALKESGIADVPESKFVGQSGVVLGYDDPVLPARILKEYITTNKKPAFKFAYFDGMLYDASRLNELAALPSKKDIIASILGSLNAPISGIVGSINAVMRDVASLIEEVAKKQAA
jgi:large subunit ribosomal protein L10